MKKHFAPFLLLILLVLACDPTTTIESTKVSPTEIIQNYSITGSANNTSVKATFRVASTGATIDLDAPSHVEHNAAPMNESGPGFMKGTDYNASASEFVSQHKFTFTDASGKVWKNEINLEAMEITSKDLTISKANGGMITISRPLGKDENVEFQLVSEKNPPPDQGNSNSNVKRKSPEPVYSTALRVDFDDNGTTGKIDSGSLKNFVDGKANVSVNVRKNKDIQQSAKGGSLVFFYNSQKVSATVIN